MSHWPLRDSSAVRTTKHWVEVCGYCDARLANVSTSLSVSFVQPALGGMVTVTVGSSTAFQPGDTVAISGALTTYRGGFYWVMAKPSSTSMVLQLFRDGGAPGSTVASGADVRTCSPIWVTPRDRGAFMVTDLYLDALACPGFGDTTRATVSIGWNRGGTPFSEFYSAQQLPFTATMSSGTSASSLASTFVMPALNGSVTITLATPAVYAIGTWGFPLDTLVRVARAGVFRVSGFTTTTTTAAFTQPAIGSGVTLQVASSTGFAVGDYVWISSGATEGVGAYAITATTATSITATANNVGSSFLQGVASGTSIPSGATVTHASKLTVTLIRHAQASAGQTIATGGSVFSYSTGKATTSAAYVQPTSGTTVDVTVGDNRQFVVGTNAWVWQQFDTSAGFYSITGKVGLDRLRLQLSTADTYAAGSTVPAGQTVFVRRQSGQTLVLRGTGTTRLAVDPGSSIAAYVSVASNATSAAVVAFHLRGYFLS